MTENKRKQIEYQNELIRFIFQFLLISLGFGHFPKPLGLDVSYIVYYLGGIFIDLYTLCRCKIAVAAEMGCLD
jgi:hypothetical protein